MRAIVRKIAAWPSLAVFAVFFSAAAFGQSTRPFLQDIQVQRESGPDADASLIKKTGSSSPTNAIAASAASGSLIKSAIPALAEVEIPGYSGVLVQSLSGDVIVDSASDTPFNPASNVKVATAFAVLKTFGPEYRFSTGVWTDGSYEEATGTIHGNLYVSGRDPVFGYEHAVRLASELNKMGIRNVKGDLIVTDNFAMNHSGSASGSSRSLFATLDAAKRSASANNAWASYLVNSGRFTPDMPVPSVAFTGSVYVQPMPGNVNLLFSHESAKMRDILKATLCYSNNFIAERLGEMVGGPYAVARLVQQHAGVPADEFSLQTSSGLGINRVTPRAMMKLLQTLRSELAGYRMTFADIMPVAGVDKGTLENRFDSDFAMGSVVGKTGTLSRTDGGASALCGEINTRNGKLLFVIFNQRGSVSRFRRFQNNYVSIIQSYFGGPAAMAYDEVPLNARLAKTRISYPAGAQLGS
ncbi:MAG: D-alanyl-D-alanine carboxypeptidase [Acidobacteria bacterium]|nr:D-alanyl-D-alanine carboxypeptidase [Acidobacteriota bacterium]